MELIGTDHPRYDTERRVYNVLVDRRPEVIARCFSTADVRAALELARLDGYDVAVRCGGHSVAGFSVNDGGLVVDVRPMNTVEVDPARRVARIGAGALWGEIDPVTQEHGLATTGGRASTTGVSGFTLGGGSGWLERALGFACDNLVAVDLVTADGRQVRASAEENPDLFWALHGGGGNFGVATALELRLHPVGPEVLAGLLIWPADEAPAVARAYRDAAADAPPQLGSALVLTTAPPEEFVPEGLRGEPMVAVAALWSGGRDEGEDVLGVFRDLDPAADLTGPMPYAQFQAMLDDPPGRAHYWSADYHDDFPDAALDTFVRYGASRPSPATQQFLIPWGGAVAAVDDAASPLGNRDARWVSHPFAQWDPSEPTEPNVEWARGFRRDIAEFTNGGVWLNFIGAEGEDRVRAAYGPEKYARLQAVKDEWDPTNVFRGNQNIRPT